MAASYSQNAESGVQLVVGRGRGEGVRLRLNHYASFIYFLDYIPKEKQNMFNRQNKNLA